MVAHRVSVREGASDPVSLAGVPGGVMYDYPPDPINMLELAVLTAKQKGIVTKSFGATTPDATFEVRAAPARFRR